MHIIKKIQECWQCGAYTCNNDHFVFFILQTGVLLNKPSDDKSMGPQVPQLNMVTLCPICKPVLLNAELEWFRLQSLESLALCEVKCRAKH